MATEDIQIQDGILFVERAGDKQNVEVAVSDVDSVTFVRSGGDGQGDGALVLHTADNGDVVIRVQNEDAGAALKLVNGALKKESAPVEDKAAAKKPVTQNK